MSLPNERSTALETARWAIGEAILTVNARLQLHHDRQDLDGYLRDKQVMDALERAREVLR